MRHLINIFNKGYCSKDYDSVIALQETNIIKAGLLPYIWRGNYVMTAGTGSSKGCITLLSSHLNVVEQQEIDGRSHVLACQRSDSQVVNYIIANVYSPNKHDQDKIKFFEAVIDKITELEIKYTCQTVLILGDLNIIFQENEKKNRLYTANEKRLGNILKALFRDLNVVDIWKDKPEFTWRRPNSDSFSTLDRILYRSEVLILKDTEVDWSLGFSDHAAVKVNFLHATSKTKRNKARLPRLDPTLLKDERIKNKIGEELQGMMAMSIEDWNPHLKLEYAKMCLRTIVERAQADRKKKEATIEDEINKALNRAIEELESEPSQEDKLEALERIENLRNKKLEIVEEKGSRLAEKLGTKWYNEGEKSTKYFYRILNRAMPDKINTLEGERGEEIKEEEAVNQEVLKFYKDLYEANDTVVEEDSFFNEITPISGDKSAEVLKEITADELLVTLKSCKDSAPGPDGISYSYLRSYWSTFGTLLTESWRHSLVTGELPISHKKSILRLIPKAGKNLKKLTNWRPITLSNCDHKLITKTYATRLTKQVAEAIGQRQTAYLKGRVITDNVRALMSCVRLSNLDQDIDGVITSLDAKKAFDSVNHDYIRRCLIKFGVGDFVPIFDVLYKELTSDIAVNGTIIKGYKILRGVKQGDALSCILFVMCMEPLLRNIEANQRIQPISSQKLNITLPKAFAYADDVNLVTKNEHGTLKAIFKEYERLTRNSGLMLNADKTEILRLKQGERVETNFDIWYMDQNYKLKSQKEVKINGVFFQQDEQDSQRRNVQDVARKIQKKLEPWSRRGMTLIGKILLTKTFGISQIVYIMQILSLNEDDLKLLNSVLYKFMWNRHFKAAKAPERIKRDIIKMPIKLGGFGMLDLKEMDNSIKLRALGRLFTSKHPFSILVKAKLDVGSFFFPEIKLGYCKLTEKAIDLLKEERLNILRKIEVIGNLNLLCAIKETQIKKLISPAGASSIIYFQLRARGVLQVKHLDRTGFNQIRRFITPGVFIPWIEAALRIGGLPPLNPEVAYTTWHKNKLTNLAVLSAKELRENSAQETPIAKYKIGLDLDVAESFTWCHRIKKLTSIRHQNTLLKTAHGDIYSKDRKLRFGLADNDRCDRCGSPDSRQHMIAECPKALELWNTLRILDGKPVLTAQSANLLNETYGINEPIGGELSIHAEIIQVLMNTLQDKVQTLPPKVIVRIVLSKLYNLEKGTTKENLKALLDKLNADQ